MVWPPPKVLKSPEGELTIERPHGDPIDLSSLASGAQPETVEREAVKRAVPPEAEDASVLPEAVLPADVLTEAVLNEEPAGASSLEGVFPDLVRPGPPALPGATVSVMAATAVPRDWLERPEGLLGCVLGSRYRIVGVIGRGPMGIAC